MSRLLRRLFRTPLIWQIALCGYWLGLLAGTHVPGTALQLPPAGGDKLLHFAAFAGLAALLAMTWQISAGKLNPRHLFVAWLVLVIYAAMDEWSQPPVGRVASLGDWVADALGAAVGLIVFAGLRFAIQRGERS